jgi:CDP-6-deoxy-D-xylo-4-hexulose-3-dehydrase
MQAAIGCAQMDKLPHFIKARKENFDYLYKALKKHEKYLLMPEVKSNKVAPSWFGFPILVKDSTPFTRNELVTYLEKNKIATRMLFGGNLTKQPAYLKTKFHISGNLKNTDIVMNNLFWIGVYPGLTKTKLAYLVKIFCKFMKKL